MCVCLCEHSRRIALSYFMLHSLTLPRLDNMLMLKIMAWYKNIRLFWQDAIYHLGRNECFTHVGSADGICRQRVDVLLRFVFALVRRKMKDRQLEHLYIKEEEGFEPGLEGKIRETLFWLITMCCHFKLKDSEWSANTVTTKNSRWPQWYVMNNTHSRSKSHCLIVEDINSLTKHGSNENQRQKIHGTLAFAVERRRGVYSLIWICVGEAKD